MTLTKNIFTGEYSYSIDSKNRVNIPSNYRNCLSSDNKKTFVITKGLDNCIWVYPLIFWKKIENDLKKLSSISNTNRAFIRNTARYASPVKFDKQGRINLTNVLVEYANLDKDASIIGMINKIEIWNPSILDKVDKESSKIKNDEYDELANKIII